MAGLLRVWAELESFFCLLGSLLARSTCRVCLWRIISAAVVLIKCPWPRAIQELGSLHAR